jgi:hypothetical protein
VLRCRMTSVLMASPLALAGLVFSLLGALFLIAALVALKRRRPFRFVTRTILGLVLLLVGVIGGAIGVGMQGYRALTREDLAARIVVQPIGPQMFSATVHIPGRTDAIYYELAGDALYVDAHILKWRPWANILGLHTAYELDRIAGRYDDIEQERAARRTVHTLAPERWVNLFALRTRFAALAPLLDTEYGSGTFVRVEEPGEFHVLVSTTGLLIRPIAVP